MRIHVGPDHPLAFKGSPYAPEHRVVMSQKLGRMVEGEECVHHINGDKADNRLENLMLFASAAAHSRYHALN